MASICDKGLEGNGKELKELPIYGGGQTRKKICVLSYVCEQNGLRL